MCCCMEGAASPHHHSSGRRGCFSAGYHRLLHSSGRGQGVHSQKFGNYEAASHFTRHQAETTGSSPLTPELIQVPLAPQKTQSPLEENDSQSGGVTKKFNLSGLSAVAPSRNLLGYRENSVIYPIDQAEEHTIMQHPLDIGAHYFPHETFADHRSHRYRSFMIEEILTDHQDPKTVPPTGELLKFGVQALLSTRPYHNHLALLKAEQASMFKFPLSPLNCPGLSSPISSALLAASQGLQGGSGSPHHLPLELHLRGKLEAGVSEQGSKAKKGRRSRTVFTELQLMGLEKRFEKQKYLSTPDRIDLAESLGLSQLQVKTWYQNRRMKWKKIVLQGGGLESPTKPKGRPKKNSIPSCEQLSEQEKAKEAEKQLEELHSPCEVNQEE